MDGKWKLITDIKEIGDKTDKVETTKFPEYISRNCNLTTCRYNADGKCTNEENRKECIRVSKAVLCMDEKSINDFYARMDFETMTQWKDRLTDTCDTNPNCENDPANCGFAVEYSTLEDVGNGIHKYMCGRDKCKYCK